MVTFITREDIFGKDIAKYTFTEQCEEIRRLRLGDGTTKLFLNMTSKNGDPALVSLLQYMKKTELDNPEILIRDERICRLDQIVKEVKQSEEWEDVKMSVWSAVMERGLEQGRKEGRESGIALAKKIFKLSMSGLSAESIAKELALTPEEIRKILE